MKHSTTMSEMDMENARNYMCRLLTAMTSAGGSDLFIARDFPPSMKMNGKMVPLTSQPLPGEVTQQLVFSVMNRHQRSDFEKGLEANFAISVKGLARFRVNAFVQQHYAAMVLRVIPSVIPTIEQLGLPESLKEIVEVKRGLVLVVGAPGSGKSTTLAAMIDHLNRTASGHIVTVEQPVEFVHRSQSCLVSQREVGVDTHNWENALMNALRQAPDVILIGEIRDRQTMEHAISFAETGHLCLGTLHANSASQTIDRIVNFFPEQRRQQLMLDLSSNLRSIISQRLIPTLDKKSRVAAVEILVNTPLIAERILNGEFNGLKDVMGRSRELGMRTFDWALFELYNDGRISYEEALRNADSVNELRLNIKLKSTRGEPRSVSGLTLTMEEVDDHFLTGAELEAERLKEMARQEERRKQLERDQLEAAYHRNRRLHERRRQKEDAELSRLMQEKSQIRDAEPAPGTDNASAGDAAAPPATGDSAAAVKEGLSLVPRDRLSA